MSDELELIRQTAAQFCAEHGGAGVLRARRAGQPGDGALFDACVAQGFIGVALAEEHGGMDLGWPALVALIKEGGKALIELPVLSAHQLPIEALLGCPDGATRSQRLAQLSSGRRAAVAWQSEARRPDVFAPSVQATQAADGWRLSGRATMVLGGLGASGYVVSAQCDDGLMVCWVDRDAAGLEVQAQALIDHRNSARLVFDEVLVADAQLVARGGPAREAIKRMLDAGRLGLAAQMVGGAQASFEMTLEYLKTRQQFGVPIGSFQALQHRISQVFIRLQMAEAALRIGVDQFALGGAERARAAALAKAQCGEAYSLASREGVQLHGGIGVTDEHDIGFHLKSAQVGSVLFGDAHSCRSTWAALAGY